jgi:hypothetical protein
LIPSHTILIVTNSVCTYYYPLRIEISVEKIEISVENKGYTVLPVPVLPSKKSENSGMFAP